MPTHKRIAKNIKRETSRASAEVSRATEKTEKEISRTADRVVDESKRIVRKTEEQSRRVPAEAKQLVEKGADAIKKTFGFVFDLVPGSGTLKLIAWGLLALILFLIFRPLIRGLS